MSGNLKRKTGLSVYNRDYEVYIGESWDSIGEDETKAV